MRSKRKRGRPPTVLRTFRLSSAIDEVLTRDAERKKIGKNALVTSILSKYVEWDSGAADFGYLTVPPEMIFKLIASLDEDTIATIAREVSLKVASSLQLWFGSADLDGIIKYFETSVKYSGARLPQRIERVGNVTRIIVYQPFSKNGLAWIRAFDVSLIQNVLGYPPTIIEHADSIETIIVSKEKP